MIAGFTADGVDAALGSFNRRSDRKAGFGAVQSGPGCPCRRVSDAFPDGVHLVDFSPVHDPSLVLNTIAQARLDRQRELDEGRRRRVLGTRARISSHRHHCAAIGSRYLFSALPGFAPPTC